MRGPRVCSPHPCWQWGAVERSPRRYDWTGYRQLFSAIKPLDLKVQVAFEERNLPLVCTLEGACRCRAVVPSGHPTLNRAPNSIPPFPSPQVVMSFHACGGNVGDNALVPLPAWVHKVGDSDPDIFFTDRPREASPGQRNREYISWFAEEEPGLLRSRSVMECYVDFMRRVGPGRGAPRPLLHTAAGCRRTGVTLLSLAACLQLVSHSRMRSP